MLNVLIMRTVRVLATIGLLSLIAGGGLLLTALFPTLLSGPVAFLMVKDEPIKAGLIVVLAGSPVARTLEARDLYKLGLSGKILLIPEPPNRLRQELIKLGFKEPSQPISQRILVASGVPLSAVDHLPANAGNTKGESQAVKAYAAKHAVKSILLVTSPTGSRRQCWIFRRALPTVRISCQPTTYEDIEHDRRLALHVINEYLKMAANTVGIY